jgi:glycosyltransferase involved in cell wall biosynthesis
VSAGRAAAPGDAAGRRLLVVSHPSVLAVNQLPYAALARRGWQVDLVTPARWRHEYSPDSFAATALPELSQRHQPKRVVLIGHPQRHLYLTNPFATIRRHRPAVLFCEQEPFAVPAAQWTLAARALGVPYGVQQDENLDRDLPVPARAIRRAVLPHAAFVAARSATAVDLALAWGARGEVDLIPHHVPGWPETRRPAHPVFTVGFCGRLTPEKGLDTLVAALRRFDQPTELLVAGGGPQEDWLQAADLGSASLRLVRGVGHGEMNEIYAQMDVLVLPSRTTPTWAEQFGRVLVEALWCGTPVIGSDSGEIPWVIETSRGGLVFPEADAGALAAEIERLRAQPALGRQLAEEGRRTVIDTFSVEVVADKLERALSSAAGLGGPTDQM